ncbi:hypothetical protein, partial [Microcoleus sp. herbarium12]|uniref:hypothetical protein n=1 Tax=Microcoleus sp. herbarium12 TaxID=3055437 RepID=UPI002FD1D38C
PLPLSPSPSPVQITKKNIKLAKGQAIDSSEQHSGFSRKNPIFAVFCFYSNRPSDEDINNLMNRAS